MLQRDTLLNDRYRIIEPVGEGGMATVYRAVDTRLGRTVAVKVLHPEYSRDRPFLQRFQQEAEFAASLGAHPNIVDIYDIGQDGGLHYIVMEFVEGSVLNELIERNRRLSVPEAFAIGQQVASALDFAHKRGLVHRDVKPQNILITDDGQAKVTDFGIARSVTTSQLTRTGMVIGTVHYFSPEQAQGAPLGPASDIYSLGVILYQMLTGHLPFDAENAIGVAMQHVHSAPPSPWNYNPDLPARAVATVMRALEKDPAQRYRDAAEFASALGSQAAPEASGTTTVSPLVTKPRQRTAVYQSVPPPPPPREERVVATPRRQAAVEEREPQENRRAWIIMLGVLLVLAAGAAAFFLASGLMGRATAQATQTPTATATPHPTKTPRPSKPTTPPTTAPVYIPTLALPTFTPVPPTLPPASPTLAPPTSTPKPRPTQPPPQPTIEITPLVPTETPGPVG